jgi:hypothetical protein
MKAAVVGAMVLAMIGAEARARAGSCGGDSDSGGSSDSGSSSSSSDSGDSSSSDSSTTTVVSCVETSDVLGRRQCSGFGTWAMGPVLPTVTIEVGTSVRSIATGRLAFSGTVDHGDLGSYRFTMRGRPSDDADAAVVGADLRAIAGRRWYGGVELTVGGVAADDRGLAMTIDTGDTQADATPTLRMYVGTGAVAGVRAHLGPVTLAAEAFAGVRVINATVESRFGTCETTASARDVSASLELRARAEAWVTPWMTVGAFTGQDVRLPETRSYGLDLGGHVRAFDGSR